MKIALKKLFHKDENIVIGSLHFPPLLGSKDFPGYKQSLKMALDDLEAYEKGGVDAIFLENNYGLSKEKIGVSQAVAMGYLIGEIRSRTKMPLGASVLWNDYETAFALATTYNLQFIRIPVFVDTVQTYCGVVKGAPKKVLEVQIKNKAEDVAIFADILVKHSKHISKHSLETAAKKAIKNGADGIIVTGDWTGQSPTEATVKNLRKNVGKFPIIIGSGANAENVNGLCDYANGVIVSTSLKQGFEKKDERNVKSFHQRVSPSKVKKFVDALG